MTCKVRNPKPTESFMRCERDKGHSGAHAWDGPSGEHTWPNDAVQEKAKKARTRMKRGSGPARRTRLNPETDAHKVKRERWALIKLAMIYAQRRTQGYISCMECGAIDPAKVELAHLVPAGKGGAWEPHNAALLCAGPGTNQCHEKYDGNLPVWSSKEAS